MLALIVCKSEAQNFYQAAQPPKHFETLGGLMGWGNSFSKNTYYQVYFFMTDYSRSFKVPKKKDVDERHQENLLC